MSWAHTWGKNSLSKGKNKKQKTSAKGPGRYPGTEFMSISIFLRLVHLSSPLGFGAEGRFLIVIRRLVSFHHFLPTYSATLLDRCCTCIVSFNLHKNRDDGCDLSCVSRD